MPHYNYGGLIYGGGWYLMSVQALEAVVIIAWTVGMTLPALWVKLSKFEIQNINGKKYTCFKMLEINKILVYQ